MTDTNTTTTTNSNGEVVVISGETEADTPPAGPLEVDVALKLSRHGKPNGKTRTVRMRRPDDTQIIWFQAAGHRFDLAVDAWKDGVDFGIEERREVVNDMLLALQMFMTLPSDRLWLSQAMALGEIEMRAIYDGILEAQQLFGLDPDTPAADVVIDS